MKNPAATGEPRNQTFGEAAGYTTGIFLSMLRWFLPLRVWVVLVASAALIVIIWRSLDAIFIARAVGTYLILLVLVTFASVCRKRGD